MGYGWCIETDVLPAQGGETEMSYHNLHITTLNLARTSIFNLPYRVRVTCSRVAGWEVWALAEPRSLDGGGDLPEELLGGEYGPPLRLDVAGHIIVDSFPEIPQ